MWVPLESTQTMYTTIVWLLYRAIWWTSLETTARVLSQKFPHLAFEHVQKSNITAGWVLFQPFLGIFWHFFFWLMPREDPKKHRTVERAPTHHSHGHLAPKAMTAGHIGGWVFGELASATLEWTEDCIRQY